MCGSQNTSPTGLHGRNYSPGQVLTMRPDMLMKSQSASSATLPSAVSCSVVNRRWRRLYEQHLGGEITRTRSPSTRRDRDETLYAIKLRRKLRGGIPLL